MPNNGTPKTLTEAIRNGILDATGEKEAAQLEDRPALFLDQVIHNHVKDYLSQAFNVAELKGMSVMELWSYLNAKK